MFLAINEIKYDKVRYSLIIAVIGLISFLIFIISALALGLAHQNTAAIENWHTQSALMTKDANGNMGQSLMQQSDIDKQSLTRSEALVGITPANVKADGDASRDSVQYIGLRKQDYIYQDLKLSSGHLPKNDHEVIIADTLDNFKLNDKIKIGLDDTSYKVVGITDDALYNMAPVVYGNLDNWAPIKGVTNQFKASGIISKSDTQLKAASDQLKAYNLKDYMNNLPGYQAQILTFTFMISFLILISLIVVTIFLYILTIQKLPNLAVLRAQGIPNRYLILNTFNETLLIMVISVAIGAGLTTLTAFFIPDAVPVYFDIPLMSLIAVGMLITGLLGALIPMRIISKIDPVTVIGG